MVSPSPVTSRPSYRWPVIRSKEDVIYVLSIQRSATGQHPLSANVGIHSDGR